MKRVALITGVAGGIGIATTKVFAEAGWSVLGMDLPGSKIPAAVDHFFPVDLTREADVKQAFQQITNQVEGIDTLINNAAILLCKPLLETDTSDWDYIMAVNVRSVFLMVRYAAALLRKVGGSVVNVGSVHAIATSPGVAAYAASKGAVVALTRALAIELAPEGIRVNALLPGATDTPMLHDSLNLRGRQHTELNAKLEALGKQHVLGRIGKPQEIARAILFLSDSQSSSFITGQILIVDGGATARLSTE